MIRTYVDDRCFDIYMGFLKLYTNLSLILKKGKERLTLIPS